MSLPGHHDQLASTTHPHGPQQSDCYAPAAHYRSVPTLTLPRRGCLLVSATLGSPGLCWILGTILMAVPPVSPQPTREQQEHSWKVKAPTPTTTPHLSPGPLGTQLGMGGKRVPAVPQANTAVPQAVDSLFHIMTSRPYRPWATAKSKLRSTSCLSHQLHKVIIQSGI
jgi:hypothetical protein